MDPSYLKYRFKKKNLLTCYSVVLLPENVMFAFFLCKKCKEVPMCHIYLSIHAWAHMHTLSVQTSRFTYLLRENPPELSHLHRHCSTLKTTLNHAPNVWWFLYQKPYHTNLCTPTTSISITVTRIKILFWLFSCQYSLPLYAEKWRC